MTEVEPWVTVEVVAMHLGMSAYWVRNMAARSELPARKVGGRWRFRLSEIDAYLARPRDLWEQSPQARRSRRS